MRFPLLISTPAIRTAVALLLPFAITGIQWLFWDAIRPFAWFFYFPSIFISAWLGSLRVGIITTLYSAMLARFFFMSPNLSLEISSVMQLINMLMFVAMGILLSFFNERLRLANQQTVSALEQQAEQITAQQLETCAQLKLSEDKYRLLAEQAVELIFWKEADGQYSYVSSAAQTLTGYAPEEFQQDPELMSKVIHPDDLASYHEHAIHDTEPDEGELDIRLVTRDGTIRWISHHCRPMYNDDGRYLGRHGINRDITDRKLAEEELRQRCSELERFNRASVGRELEMIRLKQQVNELSLKLGQTSPYHLELADIHGQDAL